MITSGSEQSLTVCLLLHKVLQLCLQTDPNSFACENQPQQNNNIAKLITELN